MADPSPAAQAVLDAAGASEPGIYATIAAALRAAADQVVPENLFGPAENVAAAQREITRREILAIATELEAQ